jgi:hypothetical protein
MIIEVRDIALGGARPSIASGITPPFCDPNYTKDAMALKRIITRALKFDA